MIENALIQAWQHLPSLHETGALRNQEQVAFEAYAPRLTRWFDVRAYPVPDGLAVYFRDITESKRSEDERRHLLIASKQTEI